MPTVTFIELWMHAGSLERSVSAESNSNFLNALQTSRVHPWLDLRTAKSMIRYFYDIADTTSVLRKGFVIVVLGLPRNGGLPKVMTQR